MKNNAIAWPIFEHFAQAVNSDQLKSVPESWLLIQSDVTNSTQAIHNGRYQDVNRAGVLTLVALANFTQNLKFPYIFGGDGVVALIPAQDLVKLRAILADLQQKIHESLQLDLRIGVWSIQELYQQKLNISIGYAKSHNNIDSCIIQGDAIKFTEEQLKKQSGPWHIQPQEQLKEYTAEFTGYSCRWADIPSPKDSTIALIIEADPQIFPLIYSQISQILGQDWNPISTQGMRQSSPLKVAFTQTKILSKHQSLRLQITKFGQVLFEWFLVYFCVRFKINFRYHWMNLSECKEQNVQNADYLKYDGTLKLIASVNSLQIEQLLQLLEEKRQLGQIFYGLHTSDSAHITCALHIDSEMEIHFVDATGGGYTQAALALKQQKINSTTTHKHKSI